MYPNLFLHWAVLPEEIKYGPSGIECQNEIYQRKPQSPLAMYQQGLLVHSHLTSLHSYAYILLSAESVESGRCMQNTHAVSGRIR